jgi:hypothetical protein
MSVENPADEDLPVILADPGTAKTIGVLNMVFGVCLILCVGCYGASVLMQSLMAPAMAAQQEQMQLTMKAARDQQLVQIRQQESAAKGAEEKARLQAQRKALESQVEPKMPDFTHMYGLDDPLVQGYYLTDVATAFALNVALLVSGIGLINLKEWGRLLALWVAGLKIARLVTLYGFYLVVIVPIILQRMTTGFQELGRAAQQGAGGAGPPPTFGATFGTVMAAAAAMMVVLGVIYPIIVLILLSRRGVKAACSPAALPFGD